MSAEDSSNWLQAHRTMLNDCLTNVDSQQPETTQLQAQWATVQQAPPRAELWDTGVDIDMLKYVGAQSVRVPDDFVCSCVVVVVDVCICYND